MNVLDLAIIAVVVLSGLFAFARGFVKEALSIGAWVGAIFVALHTFAPALPVVERFLPKGIVAQGATGLIVFFVPLIAFGMLTGRISRRIRDSSLSALDRTCGLLFGLFRGGVLVCLGYIALAWVLPAGDQRPTWFAQARTLPLLANGAAALRSLAPGDWREKGAATAVRTENTVEKEVESAIGAYRTPKPRTGTPGGAGPSYSPNDRQDLNRLIEQNAR
jgi:membrane protein required for colicin V production